MKKFNKVLLLITLMIFAFTSSALASSATTENISLKSLQSEKYDLLSKQVLDLYEAGQETEAAKLPDVIEFREMMKSNQNLEATYISSLQAMKALREKTVDLTLKGDETKIIKFDDNSFIKLSSKTTSNKIQDDPILRDPPVIYHGTEDYGVVVMGLYPVATLHLFTDYDYGNYYVNITDVNVDSSVFLPAWIVSQTPSRLSDTSSKGVFVYQDPFGTSSDTLKTVITPHAYYVTINNTHY